MNSQNNELRKKIEENLPDYIFGRLSKDDIIFFEQNVNLFPDLMKECDDAKAFFNKLENMDFDKVFDEHTKNISVKVHNKMQKIRPVPVWAKISRIAFPVVAIAALFFINSNFTKIDNKKSPQTGIIEKNTTTNAGVYQSKNANPIVESKQIQDEYLSDEALNELSDKIINKAINDHYDNDIKNTYSMATDFYDSDSSTNQNGILQEIENMSEHEFQNIISEFSDEINKP